VNADQFLREGFYGGHADAYIPYGEDVYYYVNSLYPFAMQGFDTRTYAFQQTRTIGSLTAAPFPVAPFPIKVEHGHPHRALKRCFFMRNPTCLSHGESQELKTDSSEENKARVRVSIRRELRLVIFSGIPNAEYALSQRGAYPATETTTLLLWKQTACPKLNTDVEKVVEKVCMRLWKLLS
jgi:hypothetical protein